MNGCFIFHTNFDESVHPTALIILIISADRLWAQQETSKLIIHLSLNGHFACCESRGNFNSDRNTWTRLIIKSVNSEGKVRYIIITLFVIHYYAHRICALKNCHSCLVLCKFSVQLIVPSKTYILGFLSRS